MKVIIDPTVKQLFFDRVIESHNGDSYDALKWIEKIAFGEDFIMNHALSGLTEKIQSLKSEIESLIKRADFYKKRWRRVQDQYDSDEREVNKLRRKFRGMDEEIESYCDEIKYYRQVMESNGLSEYIDDYDQDGEYD